MQFSKISRFLEEGGLVEKFTETQGAPVSKQTSNFSFPFDDDDDSSEPDKDLFLNDSGKPRRYYF